MARLFDGLIMCLSMFTILPMPMRWEEKSLKWVIPLLPLAGAAVGGIWYGAALLLMLVHAPLLLSAALLALCPMLATGFIHVDGFMDTSDAVLSRAPIEKKRAILKDSHVGAFAVIAILVLVLLMVAAMHGALERGVSLAPLLLIPIASRCASGIALLYLHPMSKTGYGASFQKDAKAGHRAVLWAFALSALVLAYLTGRGGLISVACALAGGAVTALFVSREMGGMSGDLCGCVSTVSELCGLLALALV